MGKKSQKVSHWFFLFLFSLQLPKSGVYLTANIEYEHFWRHGRYIYLKGREEIFFTIIPLRRRESTFCLQKFVWTNSNSAVLDLLLMVDWAGSWVLATRNYTNVWLSLRAEGWPESFHVGYRILSVPCVRTSLSICTSYDHIDTIQWSLSSHILLSAAILLCFIYNWMHQEGWKAQMVV